MLSRWTPVLSKFAGLFGQTDRYFHQLISPLSCLCCQLQYTRYYSQRSNSRPRAPRGEEKENSYLSFRIQVFFLVCKPLIQGCLFYYYLLWATFFKKDLSDLHGGNFQVIGQLEVRNRETAGMHLAFLLRKEGQLVHTVEANYYQASTLLNIS